VFQKYGPSIGKIGWTDNQGLFSIPQQVMDTKYITQEFIVKMIMDLLILATCLPLQKIM